MVGIGGVQQYTFEAPTPHRVGQRQRTHIEIQRGNRGPESHNSLRDVADQTPGSEAGNIWHEGTR